MPRGPKRARRRWHVWPTSRSSDKRGHGRHKGPWRRHILVGAAAAGANRQGQAQACASDASKRFASPVAGCGLPAVRRGSGKGHASWAAGGQEHRIARVYGKRLRCVVLPTMRSVSGTRRHWRAPSRSMRDMRGSRSRLAWSCKVRRACAASARQRMPSIELQPQPQTRGAARRGRQRALQGRRLRHPFLRACSAASSRWHRHVLGRMPHTPRGAWCALHGMFRSRGEAQKSKGLSFSVECSSRRSERC